ncbi:MAG: DUF3604 domain-containing protein [Actinomycetota bacterium]
MSPRPTHMGESFTDALPTEDPMLYGAADLEPNGSFPVRTHQTFRLTYTAGRYGLDDTGSIKVVFRFTFDGGDLQFDDPTASNYVTAVTSNGVPLRLSFSQNGHVRPWYQALHVFVSHGYLREGDTISITVGDTSGGSPGYLVQSMCESAFTWRVLADVCATGHHVPIATSPTMEVTPGPPATWKVIAPTHRRPGELVRVGIKAEDAYGNPSDQVDAAVELRSDHPIDGLPATVRFQPGERAACVELTAPATSHPEPIRFQLVGADGTQLAASGPLRVSERAATAYWGDMHGQSGESVGLNTAHQYFTFARDLAFLDATSHQANDFQINAAFWAHINELTAAFHEDGRFLAIPGYEWSGNTGVGGDRNVYFRREGRTIRRSSHALIDDRHDIDTDAPTARQLFADLAHEDAVVYAHIGGRPADVSYAHDPRLETAMEIHSAWGTFEWLMDDCFREGYRVGVVANSDGHKGRPGASHPGMSQFGAYGGLTCFLLPELTRDAWFACLRARRHYATTGDRIHLDVEVHGDGLCRFEADPQVEPDARSDAVDELGMGDIGVAATTTVVVRAIADARAPIERVDVLRGSEVVDTHRNPASPAGSRRVRVLWRGAAVKGRGARADWRGRLSVEGATIDRVVEINNWNADRPVRQDASTVEWESVTAGNFAAFDLWLTTPNGASGDSLCPTLSIETNHGAASVIVDDDFAERSFELGGLDLELHVSRLAMSLDPAPLRIESEVALHPARDTPIWVRVTTEDGFQAWSSPVYLLAPDSLD